jgi:hypothetical protein
MVYEAAEEVAPKAGEGKTGEVVAKFDAPTRAQTADSRCSDAMKALQRGFARS